MVTLEAVRQGAAPDLYPRHLLVGCESALVLFAAAFHGQQDAVWMAEAGVTATCVDIDDAKLNEMECAYPDDWTYIHGDVFDYAARTERQWDVVSIDCPTNLFERCAELLPVWCLLARKAIVLGTDERRLTDTPVGWLVTDRVRRSNFRGGVYWAVLERIGYIGEAASAVASEPCQKPFDVSTATGNSSGVPTTRRAVSTRTAVDSETLRKSEDFARSERAKFLSLGGGGCFAADA